jgi:hypothetical protein
VSPLSDFSWKMHVQPAMLFPVIIIGPFKKWGIDFNTFHLPSDRGHHYILVAINYFMRWVEAMPTFVNDGETKKLFLFNQVIARFRVPREIATDHGIQFQIQTMLELVSKLGFKQEILSPYYPQVNG